MTDHSENKRKRLPPWLKRGLINSEETRKVRKLLAKYNLNTVCDHARCPNKGECYSKQVATFMVLGNKCTRNCLFCSVQKDIPDKLDLDEPQNVAEAIKLLELNYVVLTSVTRDDLQDGGAGHFANIVQKILEFNKDILVEVLIPDFKGDQLALKTILDSGISVLNHNIETVKSLYKKARPGANYQLSLEIIKYAKEYNSKILTKSGLMLGLGETDEQIIEVLQDLRYHKCDIVTIGQYIQPTKQSLLVEKYYPEEDFERLKQLAENMGFKKIIAGPLVRSSYKAFDTYKECI